MEKMGKDKEGVCSMYMYLLKTLRQIFFSCTRYFLAAAYAFSESISKPFNASYVTLKLKMLSFKKS